MKPKLRKLANSAIMDILYSNVSFPFQNCLNCLNFNEQTELCKLCNMRPPAKIIAYGCEAHEDHNDIPF
jgi:hypothetical protein